MTRSYSKEWRNLERMNHRLADECGLKFPPRGFDATDFASRKRGERNELIRHVSLLVFVHVLAIVVAFGAFMLGAVW